MPHNSWTLLNSRTIADYDFLSIREDRYRFAHTGDDAPFVFFDSSYCALVVATTTDNDVILVRQYRHGIQEVVLEVPGGVVDEGESPEEAAVRELQEETGFAAGSVRLLGKMMPNPAINVTIDVPP